MAAAPPTLSPARARVRLVRRKVALAAAAGFFGLWMTVLGTGKGAVKLNRDASDLAPADVATRPVADDRPTRHSDWSAPLASELTAATGPAPAPLRPSMDARAPEALPSVDTHQS